MGIFTGLHLCAQVMGSWPTEGKSLEEVRDKLGEVVENYRKLEKEVGGKAA